MPHTAKSLSLRHILNLQNLSKNHSGYHKRRKTRKKIAFYKKDDIYTTIYSVTSFSRGYIT